MCINPAAQSRYVNNGPERDKDCTNSEYGGQLKLFGIASVIPPLPQGCEVKPLKFSSATSTPTSTMEIQGGWSLGAASCPNGTKTCDAGAFCCPNSLDCMKSTAAIAAVCCPGGELSYSVFTPASFSAILRNHY